MKSIIENVKKALYLLVSFIVILEWYISAIFITEYHGSAAVSLVAIFVNLMLIIGVFFTMWWAIVHNRYSFEEKES